jgi:4-amino-4-deoxy-L-arabinose transferase-like glycosyltransferase
VVMAESAALLCGALAVERLHATDRALPGAPRAWLAPALGLGAALGTGLLVKELGAVLAVACLLALLAARAPAPRRAGALALAVLAVLLITAPWAARNLRRHGVPLLTGSFGHLSVVVDNAPPGESGWLLLQRVESLAGRVELARGILRRELLEYPGLTAQRAVQRLRTLAGPEIMLPSWLATGFSGYQADARSNLAMVRDAWRLPPGPGRVAQLLCGAAWVLLLGFAAAGWRLAPPGALRRAAGLLVLGLLLACALTVALDRYRLVLLPLALPFAGLALATRLHPALRATAGPARLAAAWRTGVAVGLLLAATMLVLPSP